MTITLFAQPYDISAAGFYFETVEQYDALSASAVNDYGGQVEEFEIQFIDGEPIDCALAKAWEIDQGDFAAYLKAVEAWDHHEKLRVIITLQQGIPFDPVSDDLDGLDVEVYEEESLRGLAERFVEEGLFGEIPEPMRSYIDYDAIARDLGMEYAVTEIAGERLVYRCG